MNGKLYLIPLPIAETDHTHVLPATNLLLLNEIEHYIVENIRTARRFLKKAGYQNDFDEVTFYVLNKHTPANELEAFLAPILSGHNVGLMSEAGVPCVADPGSLIVEKAHQQGVVVKPLTGPSSLMLSLMASGLNGQQFAFNGYLPIRKMQRIQKIKMLEKRSLAENQTQLFIEAPYRNNQLVRDLLSACKGSTMLCIATDISGKNEFIRTLSVDRWKSAVPDLNKKNTVFLLHQYSKQH